MASAGSTFTTPQSFKPIGDFKYLRNQIPSEPSVDDVEIISDSVPVGKKWNIYSVKLDSGVQCRCKIYHGTLLIGSFRNGVAKPSGKFKYDLPYAIPSGDAFSVLVDFTDGFPVVDVGCYVEYTET